VIHLFGDMITKSGVPLLWPIPLSGRMWRMIAVPNGIAIRAGGPGEIFVLRTIFTVVALLAAVGMFAPSVLHNLDPDAWAAK
jgi:hypothetical protein